MDSNIKNLIWDEGFWLPENFGWEELEDVNKLNVYDLFYCIPVVCCILILRHIVKNKISTPFGKYLGLKDKPKKNYENNPGLEKQFKLYGQKLLKDREKLSALAKKGLGDERQIERWLRKRISLEKHSKLAKFSESHWRLMWYISTSLYGFYVLWDQPWLWDIQQCWTNFPLQAVSTTIKWYYIVSCGYSLTLMLIQFNLPRKKDHWQLVIHHFATTFLLMMSYMSNFIRIGCVVLFLHDGSDLFLQLTKISTYTKIKFRNFSVLLFLVIWILTRLIFFPFIIYDSVQPREVLMFPSFYVCIGMLCVLQCLHIIWSFYIYRILISAVTKGHEIRDARSSTDSSE